MLFTVKERTIEVFLEVFVRVCDTLTVLRMKCPPGISRRLRLKFLAARLVDRV